MPSKHPGKRHVYLAAINYVEGMIADSTLRDVVKRHMESRVWKRELALWKRMQGIGY